MALHRRSALAQVRQSLPRRVLRAIRAPLPRFDFALLLGLVLIESLGLYTLVIIIARWLSSSIKIPAL
jgi:hypothetical protein